MTDFVQDGQSANEVNLNNRPLRKRKVTKVVRSDSSAAYNAGINPLLTKLDDEWTEGRERIGDLQAQLRYLKKRQKDLSSLRSRICKTLLPGG